MLCGASWRPTVVRRVIETYQTSTRVARVSTDQGTGFLKGIGNPAGNFSLIGELVAAELAGWFGLYIPRFSIVSTGELAIPIIDGGFLTKGPAFISREIDGFGGLVGPDFFKRLAVPADVSRLIMFDSWIRNADRCHPDPDNYPPNYDNLFFTPSGSKFRLVALDHSQAFVESGLEASLFDKYVLEDDGIYGRFPEFASLIDFEAVTSATLRLQELDPQFVQSVVASIPAEWSLSDAARRALVDMIVERAKFVSKYLPQKLLDDPGLKL